jgi:hypothetical protein
MEKNFNIIAKDLFGKIRTQFPSVKLKDETSKATSVPEEARFFEFNYEKEGKNLGTVTISLSDEGLAVMYSNSIVDSASTSIKSQWFKFLRSLRDFAKQHLLNFDTRDITKSNLEKRGYETLSNKNFGEGQMTESKLWGSSKTSYQDIGESRLIVKHSQPVNGEVPAGRARYIEGIYIENTQGERFKYPYKHLNGARAMARHVANGGTPYDQIGEHLVSLSEELGKLRMFKGYVDRNEMVSEAMSSIQPKVSERIQSIKKEISGLQSQRYYESFVESFTGAEDKQIPEDVMNDWIDRLTVRTFNEELKNVFPYIYKLVGESDIPVVELSAQDLIGDVEIAEEVEETLDKSLDEADALEQILSSIIEGETAGGILSTDKAARAEALEKLKELLANELPVGTDGVNASESLQGIIDDQELQEIFKELADISPEMDTRQIILDYVKIKDEENGTNLHAELSGEPAPEQEAPVEEPAPEEVPAKETFSDEEAEPIHPEILEFVESMFDKETGRFPKGETGVMLAVEKKFGDDAVPHAQHAIETLISITESYRMKKMAGIAEGPFTGIGKMMMKHKLKKGIKKDRVASDDALDRMTDYDFADPDRFGSEDDFAKSYDSQKRKEKALARLSREGVAEGAWVKDKVPADDPMTQKIGAIRSRDNTTGRMTPDDQKWGKERVKTLSKKSTEKMKGEKKPALPENSDSKENTKPPSPWWADDVLRKGGQDLSHAPTNKRPAQDKKGNKPTKEDSDLAAMLKIAGLR